MRTLNDYRDRAHWSYSSLNQILNICSLQWAFQRLYKLAPQFKPLSLSFGSTFHRCLEWVSLNRKEGRMPKEPEVRDLFDDLWRRQLEEDGEVKFDEEATPNTCAALGQDLVSCYLRNQDETERVIGVSQAFCIPVVDAGGNTMEKPLVGETDCVVEKEGVAIIVDWKTSVRKWPQEKAHKDLQPTAYLYAASQEGGPTRFRFDVLVKNKTPVLEQHSTTRTQDQFHRLAELVKVAEKIVTHECFLPNEAGFYCSGCGFQAACKAWHREQARSICLMEVR